MKLNDTSSVRKTADLFLEQIKEVIAIVTNDWQAKVVAFTSDASGESRKARKLLSIDHPSIVTLDCYSHQVSFSVLKIAF